MKRRSLPLLLALFPFLPLPALAEVEQPGAPPENCCHDQETTAAWEKMFQGAPEDPTMVKLYSLRKGLCAMIEEGKISFEFGSALWNAGHARSVIDRARDEAERKREVGRETPEK